MPSPSAHVTTRQPCMLAASRPLRRCGSGGCQEHPNGAPTAPAVAGAAKDKTTNEVGASAATAQRGRRARPPRRSEPPRPPCGGRRSRPPMTTEAMRTPNVNRPLERLPQQPRARPPRRSARPRPQRRARRAIPPMVPDAMRTPKVVRPLQRLQAQPRARPPTLMLHVPLRRRHRHRRHPQPVERATQQSQWVQRPRQRAISPTSSAWQCSGTWTCTPEAPRHFSVLECDGRQDACLPDY